MEMFLKCLQGIITGMRPGMDVISEDVIMVDFHKAQVIKK
jgi:hypothetical protein